MKLTNGELLGTARLWGETRQLEGGLAAGFTFGRTGIRVGGVTRNNSRKGCPPQSHAARGARQPAWATGDSNSRGCVGEPSRSARQAATRCALDKHACSTYDTPIRKASVRMHRAIGALSTTWRKCVLRFRIVAGGQSCAPARVLMTVSAISVLNVLRVIGSHQALGARKTGKLWRLIPVRFAHVLPFHHRITFLCMRAVTRASTAPLFPW